MAFTNPSDTLYYIVRETVEGTTPTTPAFKGLDTIPGSTDFSADSKALSSEVLKANRSSGQLAKTNFSSKGSLKTDFRRDTSMDLLIESGIGGAFTANVAKAGGTDYTHTIEAKYVVGGTPGIVRYPGMTVSKFGLSVDAESKAQVSLDLIGMAPTSNATAIAGSTYTAPTQGPLIVGDDVNTITIGSLTAVFTSLDLSVEHKRAARFGLGSINSLGTGTEGMRDVKLTVKMYRSDWTPETIFNNDTPVSCAFTLGNGTGNAYTFTLPAIQSATLAKNENSGSNVLVTVDLVGSYDNTLGTDLQVTKS